MLERRFSEWKPWSKRETLVGLNWPGDYAIAYSRRLISESPFSWRKEIIYVGMTNSVGGLRGRLRQFENTLKGKLGHGGADRVRFKFWNYKYLAPDLFVAVACFKCDVSSNRPADLRKMGEVARFEFLCLAQFTEKFGN